MKLNIIQNSLTDSKIRFLELSIGDKILCIPGILFLVLALLVIMPVVLIFKALQIASETLFGYRS